MAALRGIQAVDLLLEIPTGGPGLGMREAQRMMRDSGSKEFSHHPAQYLFKDAPERMADAGDPEKVVAMMDEHGIQCAQIGLNPEAPEHAIELMERFPGRFFAAASVDPNKGMDSVRALERVVKAYPKLVKGAACTPCLLYPQVPLNDKKFYPLYAKCVELDIPINLNVGVPGPRVPMDCQNPYYLDEVCWFFPELKVVMRHGGEPWTDLCVKLMLKWPNLYYSTSAFAPKHYPKDVIQFANTRGADKVMYAGYYPGLGLDRIFREMAELPFRDHVWEPFLRGNAVRVFKLEE
ncbi:MAG: amidohydrolase family protein [Dehalococcoidia bacterium]